MIAYVLYYSSIFTMDGGALFSVRTEARTMVLTEMSEICLHKNEVGGYAYNDANTLLTQIERVLKRQLYKGFGDRMKDSRAISETRLTSTYPEYKLRRETCLRHQERPPIAPAPTTALPSQRLQTTATLRKNPTGRTSSA